jgi:hypothetical protein
LEPKKKKIFSVRNMERFSTLKASFVTHDVDTLPAAKALFFSLWLDFCEFC